MLIGRDDLVDDITRSAAALTLVVGDQGIGKSAVLHEAQVWTHGRGQLAPEPMQCEMATGAASRLLLRSLAQAVAEVSRQDVGARRLGAFLVAAVERMADAFEEGLVDAAAGELVRVVDGVLPGIGSALRGAFRELSRALSGPGRTLLDAAEPSAAEVVATFAGEVVTWTGREIVLALDAAELLPEESLRVLGDSATVLPSGVFLRIALEDVSDRGRSALSLLTAGPADVQVIEVLPLTHDAIKAWLAAEGLPPEHASELQLVTNGYALHLHEAMGHLRAGGSPQDLDQSNVAARGAQVLLDRLTLEDQRRVRRLALLPRPLDADLLASLADCKDLEEWSGLARRLVAARLFAGSIDGERWFHELRRRWIVAESMGATERQLAAHAAADVVWDHFRRRNDPESVVIFATLVEESATHFKDEQARAAAQVDRSALAVAAALIELGEPANRYATIAGPVLEFARQRADQSLNLIDGLRQLEAIRAIYVLERDETAVVVPMWSEQAAATLVGRALSAGFPVVPRRASLAFDVAIRPRVPAFDVLVAGIGHFDAVDVVETLYRTQVNGALYGGAPEAVLWSAAFGDIRTFGGMRFCDRESRDTAAARLTGFSESVAGEQLRVDHCITVPSARLRVGRLLGAWGWATGRELHWGDGNLTIPDTPGLSWSDRAPRSTDLWILLRDVADSLERVVLRLDRGRKVFWDATGDQYVEYVVAAQESAARRVPGIAGSRDDGPYGSLLMSERLGLLRAESIISVHVIGGSPGWRDPHVELLADLAKRARQWNRRQERVELVLEPEVLAGQLRGALAERRALIARMSLLDGVEQPSPPIGRWLFVLSKGSERSEIADPAVTYGLVPGLGSEDEVEVRIRHTTGSHGHWGAELAEEFGVSRDAWKGSGPVTSIVSEFLGYFRDDVSAWTGAARVGLADPPPWAR